MLRHPVDGTLTSHLSLRFLREQVSHSGRFRETIASGGLQDDPDRCLDVHFVSGRDEYRFYIISCPDDGANNATLIDERRTAPSGGAGLLVLANKSAFGAADGWHVKQQANVARQTKPPRVSQSLPVAYHNVRRYRKVLKKSNKKWDFSEAEEAGDVGEGGFPLLREREDLFPGGILLDHNSGKQRVIPFGIGKVSPRDVSVCDRERGKANLPRQFSLNANRFLIRHVERM